VELQGFQKVLGARSWRRSFDRGKKNKETFLETSKSVQFRTVRSLKMLMPPKSLAANPKMHQKACAVTYNLNSLGQKAGQEKFLMSMIKPATSHLCLKGMKELMIIADKVFVTRQLIIAHANSRVIEAGICLLGCGWRDATPSDLDVGGK
jgi:hypothetical protein